jgi:hypothetical protein
MTSLLNFIKIYQLVPRLIRGGQTQKTYFYFPLGRKVDEKLMVG